jgi:hypothetical protein
MTPYDRYQSGTKSSELVKRGSLAPSDGERVRERGTISDRYNLSRSLVNRFEKPANKNELGALIKHENFSRRIVTSLRGRLETVNTKENVC